MNKIAALAFAAALLPLSAHAQSIHTWVSGVGDDANPCSRTAPCRTFMGVSSKTGVGGLISVIDPGGFGAISIGRSLSIVADPATATVTVSGNANAVTISAGASDDVVLSGLTLQGSGGAQIGIRVVSARSVTIRNCNISGFQSAGIAVEGNVKVFVSDCTVSGNAAGVLAKAGATVLNRIAVVQNAGSGVRADGSGAAITVNAVTVVNNRGTGFDAANGGTIASFANNAVNGNSPDGRPTKGLKPF